MLTRIGPYIVTISSGTYGDVLPLLALSRALRLRGNKVTVLTNRRYESECEAAGLETVFLDDLAQSMDMLAAVPTLNDVLKIKGFIEKHAVPRLLKAAEFLRKASGAGPIHIVSMAFFGLVSLLAESVNALQTIVFLAPDHLERWPSALAFTSGVMGREVERICARLRVGRVGGPGNLTRHPQQYIALWPSWYHSGTNGPVVRRTGFLFPTWASPQGPALDVRECFRGERPVLITHSTGASTQAKRFFDLAIDACQAVGRPSLAFTRHRDLLPDRLPESVLWAPWAVNPRTAFRQACMVIHHGGIGTTADALAAGVPQLVISDGLDRHANGRRVEALGTGRSLPITECVEHSVRAALTSLQNSPAVLEACQEFAARISAMNPAVETCDLIERWRSPMRDADETVAHQTNSAQ